MIATLVDAAAPGVTTTSLVWALLGLVSTMAGGFALLGRVAMRLFLGKELDGKGGAWGALIKSMESNSVRLDEMSVKLSKLEKHQISTVEMLGRLLDEATTK